MGARVDSCVRNILQLNDAITNLDKYSEQEKIAKSCDVTKEEDVNNYVENVEKIYIEILINAAGQSVIWQFHMCFWLFC